MDYKGSGAFGGVGSHAPLQDESRRLKNIIARVIETVKSHIPSGRTFRASASDGVESENWRRSGEQGVGNRPSGWVEFIDKHIEKEFLLAAAVSFIAFILSSFYLLEKRNFGPFR